MKIINYIYTGLFITLAPNNSTHDMNNLE